MNVDLSKYPFFSGTIENFSLLPVQGFCNENYSFKMGDQTYLLRKFKDQTLDRAFEFKVQNLAYEQGIAAKAIILDEENGLMICEFLEGHHKDDLERDNLQKLASLLQQLHSIKINTVALKLEDEFNTQPQEIKEAFNIIKNAKVENVLCHNDLNPKNILFSKDIKLIDWEYAATNDRYFDLAAISVEFKLDQEKEYYFMQSYFESQKVIHIEKLNAYKTIYTDLCKQWFDKSDINTPI